MIEKGTFSECIKTGLFFTVDGDDRVFVGDLFFNFALREFQIRGIPSFEGRKRHAFAADDKGPYRLDLYVYKVQEEPRGDGSNYVDLTFLRAKSSGEFAAWLEEWNGDKITLMVTIDRNWEVKEDLTWYKK